MGFIKKLEKFEKEIKILSQYNYSAFNNSEILSKLELISENFCIVISKEKAYLELKNIELLELIEELENKILDLYGELGIQILRILQEILNLINKIKLIY